MIKFRKYDEINHPAYGRGIIKKVTKLSGVCPVLEVQFDESGEHKQLNADWVEKNCVCYSALSEEEVQKKYVPIHLEDLPDWNMEMNKLVQFTEEMKENVYYLLKNTIPGIGFVLIGPNSAVAFFPDEDKGYQSIEKIARRYMQSVFSRHPDFGAKMLDDNGAVIFMNDDRLLHFLRPEDVITENGKLSGKTLFSARGDLMDRCAEKKILGIVKGF